MSRSLPSILTTTGTQLVVREDRNALALAAADWFVRGANDAVASRGRCLVAISGGNTPTPLFALLATPAWCERVNWARLHLFWCDERFVPPNDERSNYGVVRRVLLPNVSIPAGNVHPIPTGTGTAEEAATQYEATIRQVVGGDTLPAFDLVLLGLGDDGHTASLFPHSPLLRVEDQLVAADAARRAGTFRVTMTVPLLNAARQTMFLVSGASAAVALRDVLEGDRDPERLPAQLIRPERGSLQWTVDRAAAALLASSRAASRRESSDAERLTGEAE